MSNEEMGKYFNPITSAARAGKRYKKQSQAKPKIRLRVFAFSCAEPCSFCGEGEVIAGIESVAGPRQNYGFGICEHCIKDLQHEFVVGFLRFLEAERTQSEE
jgi:hypothetical protein